MVSTNVYFVFVAPGRLCMKSNTFGGLNKAMSYCVKTISKQGNPLLCYYQRKCRISALYDVGMRTEFNVSVVHFNVRCTFH